MIRIERRYVTYGEAWYEEKPADVAGVDIVVYRGRSAPLPGARYAGMLTLLTELAGDPAALASRFDRDCRYKVRRADNKDGLRLEFLPDPAQRLDEFVAFYDAFAAEKSLPPADRQWLAAACHARQLVFACACRDGEPLVWHASVVSGTTSRLEHSGSCFRNRETEFRALVGRANRWLHWQELIQFQALGLRTYDWGGLFEEESAPERAGINAFKRSFGGAPHRSYDCTVPVTWRGRLWLPLRDTWRGLKSARTRVFQPRLAPGEAQS